MTKPVRARILIVDDDPILLTLLSDTLGAIGYVVRAASNGNEALELLRDNQFDLMITDIKMPDIDGLQLLKKVKRHYADIPVLFITGVTSEEIMASTAADGFLAKPFRISQIETLIEETLARKTDLLSNQQRRVLLVDHDPQLRDHLSEALSKADYLPFVTIGSRGARQELENGDFDALIIEVSPADAENLEVLREICADYPNLSVIVTGTTKTKNQLQHETKCKAVVGFLTKPFEASQMLALLAQTTSE